MDAGVTWLTQAGFPFLDFSWPRLRTALGLVSLTFTIPTHLWQGARLDMPRCVGRVVAGAAQTVLLDPQNLGGGLRLLLTPGPAGGFPQVGRRGWPSPVEVLRAWEWGLAVAWLDGAFRQQGLHHRRGCWGGGSGDGSVPLVTSPQWFLRVPGPLNEVAKGHLLLGCGPSTEVANRCGPQPLDPPPPSSHGLGGVLLGFVAVGSRVATAASDREDIRLSMGLMKRE